MCFLVNPEEMVSSSKRTFDQKQRNKTKQMEEEPRCTRELGSK